MTYKLWAITKYGEGYTELIGEYEEVEDINIRTGMFAPDIVLHLTTESKGDE